jgi:hypothetical protein
MKHHLGWACASCDYFSHEYTVGEHVSGQCRRTCPALCTKGEWTRVSGDQWCGEFRNQASEVREAEQLHILVTQDAVGAEH